MTLKGKGKMSRTLEVFRSMFSRARPECPDKGNLFFCAPMSDQQQMFREMARAESQLWGTQTELKCSDCLAGGHRERLRQYLQVREETLLASVAEVGASSGLDVADLSSHEMRAALKAAGDREPCLITITQTVNQRGGRMSPSFPTLLKQTLVWSTFAQRVNTGSEALQVQGIPIYLDALNLKYKAPAHDVLSTLHNREQRFLAGNAINACVASALTIFLSGNFISFEEHSGLAPLPSSSVGEDSEDIE